MDRYNSRSFYHSKITFGNKIKVQGNIGDYHIVPSNLPIPKFQFSFGSCYYSYGIKKILSGNNSVILKSKQLIFFINVGPESLNTVIF